MLSPKMQVSGESNWDGMEKIFCCHQALGQECGDQNGAMNGLTLLKKRSDRAQRDWDDKGGRG